MDPRLLVALAVLVAGCASGSDSDPATTLPAQTASSTQTSTDAAPSAPLFTDTLRFLAIPDLTTFPATATEPDLIDVPSAGERAQQGDTVSHSMWTYEILRQANLTGFEAHLWIRVDRQMTNPYVAPGTCPWALWVEVVDPVEGSAYASRPCLTDGPVLAAGDRELVFEGSFDLRVQPGWTVGVGFDIGPYDPTAPDAIRLLAGTPELDSRIVLTGLEEPVTETL